jgi:predicted nucleotidyltransferase
MFEDFIEKTKNWGINEPFVEAIILVGSYTRGTQKADSDIDLVIITSNKQYYIDNTQIFSAFGLIDSSNIEYYGECTSIRIWYKNGVEVEFGMVP